MSRLKIFCDGACSGNPGPGAWAFVVFAHNSMIFSASGAALDTTNNRMELLAVIHALQVFHVCDLVLDSKYVMDGITSWIKKWRVNGWKSSTGEVKNKDLWMKLDFLVARSDISFLWQKGHANSLHDFADELARSSVLF